MTTEKISIAIEKVMTKWLVTVKPYGIIPNKLHDKINRNIVSIIGRNFFPFFPMFDSTIFKIIS